MKNKLNLLLLSVLLTFALVLGVSAAESTITFEGSESLTVAVTPGSRYTDTDLFDNFKNIMPGDKRTEEITIENNFKNADYIKVWMTAVPHGDENPLTYSETFENTDGKDQANIVGERDETVATMREFLAILDMTVEIDGASYDALPEDANDLTAGVYLGEFRKGESTTMDVTLTAPLEEMDNRFANRVGEVDWYFYAEGFNDPEEPEIPQFPHNVIVKKVWKDDGIGRPASITVHLLRNGVVYDTVILSEQNNWSYAWDNVDKRYEWSVEEEVPEGYVATYKTNASGWVTTITNTKILADELTVEKVWDDGDSADRPASVDVVLLCDGEYFDEVELNDRNDWTYTWENLSVNDSWSVVEKKVPEGYYVSYSYDEDEDKIIVTNTLEEPEPTELTVNKVWNDDGVNRPDSITVYLLRDGELADSVEITEAMNWTYTWEKLPAVYSWSVVEGEIDGYTMEYKADGTEVTITNTKVVVKEPYDITVKKVWSDNGNKKRPTGAEVVLYNGETAVEAVVLGDWNNWTYTWKNLDGSGNWRVSEDSVPEGYTPSYDVTDGVVTITNTETLLQTGQLNWPIPVFCGLGVILIGTGILLMRKKKENNHA